MDINNRIEKLSQLEDDIDKMDDFLSFLTKFDYESLMKDLPPGDRVDLNWNMAYAEYTMYYRK